MLFEFEDKALEPIAEKTRRGERLSFDDGVALWNSPDLLGVGYLANMVRERMHGDRTYFIHNRHINHTNICVNSCQFCAFGVKEDDPTAYTKSLDVIFEDAENYRGGKVSEFHIVGGLHPDLPIEYYLDMLSGLKDRFPEVHIQAFTAVELEYLAKIAGMGLRETIVLLREKGLGSVPGGGAEIFSNKVRRKICNEKTGADDWLGVHRTVHEVGMKSNATMLYGHLESAEDRTDHLIQLRELQDQTNGFLTFIPLAFHPENTNLSFLKTTPGQLDLKALAISRLMLDNFPHVKAFWIMITPKIAQLALSYGADDMDGTVVEEKITHAAGAVTDQIFQKDTIIDMIREAGREPVERDTLYEEFKVLGCVA
ncbi:MAG: aminofutalosine synthase MqnE [Candidatus Nitrohelix vancouverensis]|uniref:Aminodeoxyfutalosine synthase n=1 Tax=Candidatus Nitrohelix vancouverensis TaxID=2705534 RepID=A0A7T0C373_9BACT|nr:MAG: aminofutalosine synthase MqnE [Candidatus Nitrohelix vancouverensis]